MQELKELVLLFRQGAAMSGALRTYLLEPGSKTEQLFEAIANSTVGTDGEAIALVYPDSPDSQSRYNTLKSRLKDKIIQAILLSDASGIETTDRQKAYIELSKRWAAACTLFAKGAVVSGIELSETLLKKSRKFEFTEMTISILHKLCNYYAIQYGAAKKFEESRSLISVYQSVWAAENEAEDTLNELSAIYKSSREERLAAAANVGAVYQKIARVMAGSNSYRLHLSGRMLHISELMYRSDYATAAAECQSAIAFFRQQKYKCSVPSQLFNYHLIVCQIQLKQFDEGQTTIRGQQSAFEPGSWNWYKFQELLFLLSMHTGRYDVAYQLQSVAIRHKSFDKMPEMLQESWRIYEAYTQFLIKAGHVLPEAGTKAYKSAKFLNEVPRFSKDKRGANVPILFARILHDIADGKFDRLADSTEALAKYTSRYLRDDNQLRSNCFINMLIQVPEGNMHREAVSRKAEKFVERLKETPVQIADQPFELEIIPYETLWEMVLGLLGKKG